MRVFTKTATYLLPMVNKYINIKQSYVLNVYLGDELHNRYNDLRHLYIHFKFDPTEEGIKYEDYLINNPYIVGHYDVDNDTFMVIFKIPQEEHELIELYLNGKYSAFSDEYKLDIVSFYNLKNSSKVFQVIYKDYRLRERLENELGVSIPMDCELSDLPVIEKELFKHSNSYIRHKQF